MGTAQARVVVGVSGGVAAYKAAHVVRGLKEAGHHVDVVPTANALEFVGVATWEALSGNPVRTSVFEAVDTVNHVRLGQQADLVVVAPATADLLARAAAGRADDLLTATLLATAAPVVMAPAMHTEMWEHAATVANVATLRSRGVNIIEPAVGRLTGPDSGPGRLPEPADIVAEALRVLNASRASAQPSELSGRRVVVTAGGTREPLDPVRFLGNRSSGKQGTAMAAALRDAGACVTLVAAHLEVPVPDGVELVTVGTARELREAVFAAAAGADVLVMAAAVADFRPASYVDAKIKKRDDAADPIIALVRNPDILADVVAARAEQNGTEGAAALAPIIVGFAAETGDERGSVLEYGAAKLRRKGCEALVVNEVGAAKGFATDDNAVTVLFADGREPVHAAGSKLDVARAVTSVIGELIASGSAATVER